MPILPTEEGTAETGGNVSVRGIIEGAMMDIGALAAGETPEADNLKDILRKLNSMLGRWGAKKLLVPASTTEYFTLVAGTAQYTMGDAGTASTIRATKILNNAFIRDSGDRDYPVRVISEDEYNEIPDKTTRGRPYLLFYDAGYSTGYINFYYTPDAAETAYIESIKPLGEITLDNITDYFNIPREYEEAIQLNLAIRIAPMFGRTVSVQLGTDAADAYDDLMALNAGNKVRRRATLDAGLPGVASAIYNINSG